MENIIVFIIIGIAVFFIGRRFYRQFKGTGGCSGGCSCSDRSSPTCQTPNLPDFNQSK